MELSKKRIGLCIAIMFIIGCTDETTTTQDPSSQSEVRSVNSTLKKIVLNTYSVTSNASSVNIKLTVTCYPDKGKELLNEDGSIQVVPRTCVSPNINGFYAYFVHMHFKRNENGYLNGYTNYGSGNCIPNYFQSNRSIAIEGRINNVTILDATVTLNLEYSIPRYPVTQDRAPNLDLSGPPDSYYDYQYWVAINPAHTSNDALFTPGSYTLELYKWFGGSNGEIDANNAVRINFDFGRYSLATSVQPSGVGVVSVSSPGSDSKYGENAIVSIQASVNNPSLDVFGEAIPYSGPAYSFANWTDPNSNYWLSSVTMNDHKAVVANFLPTLGINGLELLPFPSNSQTYSIATPQSGHTYRWYRRDYTTNNQFSYQGTGVSRMQSLAYPNSYFELKVEDCDQNNVIAKVGYKMVYGDFE